MGDGVWGFRKCPRESEWIWDQVTENKVTRGCGVRMVSNTEIFSMKYRSYRGRVIGWDSLGSGGDTRRQPDRSEFTCTVAWSSGSEIAHTISKTC